MTELAKRRRAILGGGQATRIPAGYITEGLVFFLDAKQLATIQSWTDIVSKIRFQLTGCQLTQNGVDFSFTTASGLYSGAITTDWTNETIEAVFTASDLRENNTTIKPKAILCQPFNTNVGISLRFGDNGASVRTAIGLDGTARQIRQFPYQANTTPYVHRISINADRGIFNGTIMSLGPSSTYSKNTTGSTILGAVATSSVSNRGPGIIHAVRIYNRKLSQSEMLTNQARDLTYYNL